MQAYASASGTSSDGTAVFVGLPTGRTYESPEMLIVISPTLERMLIELALGRDVSILSSDCELPDHAAPGRHDGRPRRRPAGRDLGACAICGRPARRARPTPSGSPDRIQGLVAELIAAQNEDGGWPWVSSGPQPQARPEPAGRSAQRPAHLGRGPLGTGLGRAARAAARSQGARQGRRLARRSR